MNGPGNIGIITQRGKQGGRAWLPLLALPVILAVCVAMQLLSGSSRHTRVQGTGGVWQLGGFAFADESALLVGDVEYIPGALLAPDEFEARAAEVQTGKPQDNTAAFETSRQRILVPDGRTYRLVIRSVDYAERLYINGQWMADVGTPGENVDTAEPGTAVLSYTVQPVNGEITIVRQASNFVHREKGWHDGIYIGLPAVLDAAPDSGVTLLVLGCFVALFLVHLALFFILPGYRANLWFALFCLVWLLRTGVTGVKALAALAPGLGWQAMFRIEYLALPATAVLLILMLNELFPRVLPKWLRWGIYGLSAAFTGAFLFAGTVFMSRAMPACYVWMAAAIVAVAVCFILRFRRPRLEQWVSLGGVALFFYAGVRDMFYYSGIALPPVDDADLTRIAMLFFVFCQMTAMFMGTVREAADARQREQKALAEAAEARQEVERWREMYAAMPPEHTVLRGPLAFDTLALRAYVGGQDLLLTPKEFAILLALAQGNGCTVDAAALYHAVWKQEMGPSQNALWTQVSRLKRKLEDARAPMELVASRRAGYRLELYD